MPTKKVVTPSSHPERRHYVVLRGYRINVYGAEDEVLVSMIIPEIVTGAEMQGHDESLRSKSDAMRWFEMFKSMYIKDARSVQLFRILYTVEDVAKNQLDYDVFETYIFPVKD